MREIEFRGKSLLNNAWIVGYLIIDDISDKYYILPNGNSCNESDKIGEEGLLHILTFEVEKETIGQYTGLKDKNGKKIYEGDILLAPEWFGRLKCVCIYQQENNVNPIQGFGLYSYDSYFRKYNTLVESDEWDEFEVIGNIYDNPELLEKGE